MKRRLLLVAIAMVAAGCGADSVTTTGDPLPTPEPAPTVAGNVVEVEEQEVQAETVLIGISIDEQIEVRALPGLDQPLAGDVPPGTPIEPLGEAFETEDGLVWWQVRAGQVQGWVQPTVAYRGPGTDITDQALLAVGADSTYPSAAAAAEAIATAKAADQGAPEVVVVSQDDLERQGSATVTTDLLGFEDDSILGFRLIIGVSSSGEEWQPVSVIQLPLCARGVSPDGLCL